MPDTEKHPLSSRGQRSDLVGARKRGLSLATLGHHVAGQELRAQSVTRAAQAGRSLYMDTSGTGVSSSSTKKTGRQRCSEPTRIKWAWATLILDSSSASLSSISSCRTPAPCESNSFRRRARSRLSAHSWWLLLLALQWRSSSGSARIGQLRHRRRSSTGRLTHRGDAEQTQRRPTSGSGFLGHPEKTDGDHDNDNFKLAASRCRRSLREAPSVQVDDDSSTATPESRTKSVEAKWPSSPWPSS